MLTPEQIETMRKIQRGDRLRVENMPELQQVPRWAWEPPPVMSLRGPRLTEAGAEVLRLAEENAEAKRERLEVGLRAGFDVGALEEERDTLRTELVAAMSEEERAVRRIAAQETLADLGGERPRREILADLKRALAALGLPDPIDPRKQTLLLHIDPATLAAFEAAGFVPGSRGLEGWICEQVAALVAARRVLAAEQGRQEGAPPGWALGVPDGYIGHLSTIMWNREVNPNEWLLVFRQEGAWCWRYFGGAWWRSWHYRFGSEETARAAMQAADKAMSTAA